MNENLTILESDGERIFTVEHHPNDSAPTKAYIFVHPFAEEKLWGHRVYVTTARAFCEKGILVARFDFRGHGDSDGDYEDASLGRHIADVNTVIDHIKQSNPTINKIGLFGLRLGATIACLTALSTKCGGTNVSPSRSPTTKSPGMTVEVPIRTGTLIPISITSRSGDTWNPRT